MTSAAEFHEGALRQRRPSAQDAPSSPSLASSVKSLETRLENKFHISWDDLPAWRHDNAYIISGYHQARASYQHCARSIFHLHNESVNIWTHLLGAIFSLGAAAYLYSGVHSRYDYASPGDKLAFGCFFGGAVLCLGMSATFHALTHHSEVVMKWGNKLDYVGIVALIVGSNVPALYYGLFCEPDLMSVYLTIVCVLGAGCAVVSWVDRFRTSDWRPYRALMFVGLGLSAVVPVVHGIIIYGYQGMEDRMSVSYVIAHGAMYIFGAILYAVRWPERSFPKVFDIWGSSHQIFHMCVLIAAGTHFYGMSKAFDYHHTVLGSKC